MMRTKELEVQWYMARFERERKEHEAELERAQALNSQVQGFNKTESDLRQQLNIYVEKFKQVNFYWNSSSPGRITTFLGVFAGCLTLPEPI